MRKLRDKDLFFYKSSKIYEPYSSKCGAVDMRQPVVITDSDVKNMEDGKNLKNENGENTKSISKY